MGGGRVPATGEIGDEWTDETSPLIGSPYPGVIGLDAKGGNAKQTRGSMADRIVSYARRQRGERVGNGECYTLVNRALGRAGARRASDYGPIGPDDDYIWGSPVSLDELQAGDIIQFRNYRYVEETVTEDDEGTSTSERGHERPHHTAIVETVHGGGVVTVLEQNIPEGRGPVQRTRLYFTDTEIETENGSVTIDVSGTWWFYRAEARE
jgi:hypothetical protein